VSDRERREPTISDKILNTSGGLPAFARELNLVDRGLAGRVEADPENVERGLARLVLTLIELLRQLMERQALHRIEGGSLSGEEIERLGETFMKLEARMKELKEEFDLTDEELNLHLGPLGDLL
jgi:hypothetical protein